MRPKSWKPWLSEFKQLTLGLIMQYLCEMDFGVNVCSKKRFMISVQIAKTNLQTF